MQYRGVKTRSDESFNGPIFMKNLQLPPALSLSVDTQLERFHERACEEDRRWLEQQLDDEVFAQQLRWVWAGSEFVFNFPSCCVTWLRVVSC